jgi:hypothetical protein
MVKCDRCPCLFVIDGEVICSISNEFISFVDERKLGADCPLKRIELKDGTIFEPEVVDDKN